VQTLWQDVRFGFRMLLKKPGFTTATVITFALGIGANTAIFSVISAVLLRPLPYPEPDKLVMVWEKRIREGVNDNAVSPADFRDWKARNQVFANIAALTETTLDLAEGGEPERVAAGQVSAAFFDTLGVPPALGRGFLDEDEQPGRNRVVILNHELWRRRFGADRSVIGRTISLSGSPFEVVGVLPPSFRFQNEELALWIPLNPNAQGMQTRLNHFLSVFARIKPEMTIRRAQAEMERIGGQLTQEFPQENDNHTAFVIPLREQLVGDIRRPLLILFAAVGLVLAVACANVANLQLIRAAARRKEIALRAALGAHRRRIARQLLTESMLLAVIGGTAGALLAVWGIEAITALMPRGVLHLTAARLDLRALGFALVISLCAGALSGLGALTQASRLNLNEMLREDGRGAGLAHQRARSVVVVAEIALAIVLLIGAGLMIRSLWKLRLVPLGFEPSNVLTAQISLPSARYGDPQRASLFFRQLIEKVCALPGVNAAGAISILPLSGGYSRTSIAIEGRAEMTEVLPQARPRIHPRVVTPGYFQVMGIRLISGRLFAPQDDGSAPLVALVNQRAAQAYWPGQSPLGHRVQIGGGAPWREVIGVVGNVKDQGLDKDVNPEVYFSWAQSPQRDGTLVARGADVSGLAPAIRGQAQELDGRLPLSNMRTLEDIVGRSIAAPRSYTLLLALFAGMALTLAAVGIYGVVAYSVAQRAHEIGVRMALGARPRDALTLVLKQGMRLALIGALIGLIASWALTRLMKSLLFDVNTTDPLTFIMIPLLLTLVAMLACWIPARRAMKVDPVVALREL